MRIPRKSTKVYVYTHTHTHIYIVIALNIVLSGSLNRFCGEKWVNAIIECVIQRRNRESHLHRRD